MKIKKFQNADLLGKELAKKLYHAISLKPNLIVGLATGSTPLPFYHAFIHLVNKNPINLSKVTTFNLDEYYPIDKTNPQSYYRFMMENLFSPLKLKPSQINFLNGNIKDYKKECQDYESKIYKSGGIDWQLLGIGVNGHIGFNEPGSKFDSITRRIRLTQSTIKANARFFTISTDIPKYALTMGLGTIYRAKNIYLVATGQNKLKIIKKLISSKPNTHLPASVLKKHLDFELWLDNEIGLKTIRTNPF